MGLSLRDRKYIQNLRIKLPQFGLGLLDNFYNDFTKNPAESKPEYLQLAKNQALSSVSTNELQKEKTPKNSSINAGNVISGVTGALGTAYQLVANSRPIVDAMQLISTAPTHTTNINGIEALQYGQIDNSAADVDVAGSAIGGLASGAAAGAAFGPWGAAVGGVVGGIGGLLSGGSKRAKQQKQAEIANRMIRDKNSYIFDHTQSRALQMQEAEELGNLNKTPLFRGWSKGKEPNINPYTGTTYKSYPVNTSHGELFMPANALVSKGEVIESGDDGSMYEVGGNRISKFAYGKQPNGEDTELAFIENGDTIYSNDDKMRNPDTGNTFAEDALLYKLIGMLPRLKMNQAIMRDYILSRKGKLNKFARGAEAYTNLIPTVAGLLGSIYQYKEASEPIHAPNVSTLNEYAPSMIQKLMGLKQDYLPIWQQNREIEARGKSAILLMGGAFGAGQRGLLYSDLYNNTQQNNAKSLFDVNLANNQLHQRAYENALQVGAQDAARRQQANIFNEEFLAKAHNAALQGRQMSMFNAINALEQYYKNEFSRKQFDDMYKLYAQNVANEKAAINIQAGLNPDGTKKSKPTFNPNTDIPMDPIIKYPEISVPYRAKGGIFYGSFNPLPEYKWPIKWK